MSSLGIELDTFLALCDKAGTPLAYKQGLRARAGLWKDLVLQDIDPKSYSCSSTYLMDAQVVAFFRKYPGLDLGIDRKRVAVEGFFKAEASCYGANERISPLLFTRGHYGDRIDTFVSVWRKKMRRALGRCPSQDELSKYARFGPGSTYQNIGDLVTLQHKMSDDYTRTRTTTPFLKLWDDTAWSRYAASNCTGLDDRGFSADSREGVVNQNDPDFAIRDFSVVRGNRFTTVPKDARKDRGICVEASLNVFYQLAVGKIMTARMRRSLGWVKETCGDEHKTLARLGSLTGAVSTIDLSSASDTVCKNLVQLLLPSDWYELVCSLRSTHTFIEGKWVRLEKFSSMGNGFTFELETVIFWTLAQTVAELEGVLEDPYTPGLTISVFGDDIIVPASISGSLVAALSFFGFTTNKEKTFLEGPFRESCGGDYFRGHDVRPHYQKAVCEEPHQLISLANGLRRFGLRLGHLGHGDVYRRSWFKCLDAIPSSIRRLRGPAELGDLVIHDEDRVWIACNPMRVRNSIRYLSVWRPVPNRVIGWDQVRPGVVLACALYGTPSGIVLSTDRGEDSNRVNSSGGWRPRISGSYISGYKIGRVTFS